MQKIFLAGAILSLALCASAQKSVILPEEYKSAEGNTHVDHPVKGSWWLSNSSLSAREFRMQCVHDFDSKLVGSLSAVSFRRDGVKEAEIASPKFWAEIEVRCSTSPLRSASRIGTFASYVGKDETTVIARKKISIPAVPWRSGWPHPFELTFRFDRKFSYIAKKGSLCLDVRHWDNDLFDTTHKRQRYLFVDGFNPVTGMGSRLGGPSERCFNSNPWVAYPMQHAAHYYLQVKQTPKQVHLTWYGHQLEPNAPAVVLIGSSLHATGLPLDCGRLRLDLATVIVVFSMLADYRGYVQFPLHSSIAVKFDPKSMSGMPLYSQMLSVGAAGKLSASNYFLHSLPVLPKTGSEFPVNLLYRDGPNSLKSSTGFKQATSHGPIQLFHF